MGREKQRERESREKERNLHEKEKQKLEARGRPLDAELLAAEFDVVQQQARGRLPRAALKSF